MCIRDSLGALALLRAHGGEPFRPVEDDLADVGIGLHVVEQGGLAPQALDRREGRTGPGLAPVALDGCLLYTSPWEPCLDRHNARLYN